MARPVARLRARVRSYLPKGWGDALRQFLLFFLVYNVYKVVRGLADHDRALAISNSMHIIHFERSLGAFFEPALQQAFLTHTWIIDIANFMYLNSHFVLTTSFLIWLYVKRNENFYFVRNMFLVAMGVALIGYALFPAAPPRMIPSVGFTDTISAFAHTNQDHAITSVLVNPYAAVPSMHIAFALMIGVPGMVLCRSAAARTWWSIYPMVIFFVIVVTANHFWFDAACGAAVASAAALAATQLARLNPAAWSWRELPDEAPA